MSLKSNLFYNTSSDEIIGFEDIGEQKNNLVLSKNALVIMARGLYSAWKQPVAYFFVGTQLKASYLRSILEEAVYKLRDCRLIVEAVASDMGSNVIELANSLGVTSENTEFLLGDQKLLYIFDPSHLIKSTRNNLLKYCFVIHDRKTSWTFIEAFYNLDKKQFYRCTPKLTPAHIHPTSFEKMKVSLATQVISRTVVSGMHTYMTLGALPQEAIGTIEVLDKFNNLHDVLNSFSLKHPNIHKMVF